jgi:hypothetical protein
MGCRGGGCLSVAAAPIKCETDGSPESTESHGLHMQCSLTPNTVTLLQVQISFNKVKEVRVAPRAFGAWGDVVIRLKDGSQLDLIGFEKFREIKEHIDKCIWTM